MRDFYSMEYHKQEQSLLTKLSWERGDHDFLRKSVTRTCNRSGCHNTFKTIPSDPKRYCSQSCAAIVNNKKKIYPPKEKRFCLNCNGILVNRYKIKYCSNKCQFEYQYSKYIDLWKSGKIDGSIGITVRNFSIQIKHYLREKFNNKCAKCNWNERNPITGNIPLEVEHIDGNSENNREENLTLLCPNCHSLTPFYKNLNYGNGRKWRMDKYIKNI